MLLLQPGDQGWQNWQMGFGLRQTLQQEKGSEKLHAHMQAIHLLGSVAMQQKLQGDVRVDNKGQTLQVTLEEA